MTIRSVAEHPQRGRLLARKAPGLGLGAANGANDRVAVRAGDEPPRRRANFADRPAGPVQALVAGLDFGRPGHGRDDKRWDSSPPEGVHRTQPCARLPQNAGASWTTPTWTSSQNSPK